MKTPARLLIASLAILTLAQVEAQEIHIKARFIELPGPVASDVCLGSFNAAGVYPAGDYPAGLYRPQPMRDTLNQPKFMVGAGGLASFTGIMTGSQFQVALRALGSTPGVEELAEPEVTTSSGRQVEMRATQIITVITNFTFRETSTSSAIEPQTNVVETGPILDTMAHVLPDGYMIDLDAKASLTEFLGYDNPTHTTATNNSAGEKIDLPGILPQLRVRQASAHINLYDGQTLLLGKIKTKAVGAENVPKPDARELLVFVTVNLVDAAGNRIHSDDEMPFAKGAIPPQDDPLSRTQ
jgi:Flp pilus assembly secretin CpaC